MSDYKNLIVSAGASYNELVKIFASNSANPLETSYLLYHYGGVLQREHVFHGMIKIPLINMVKIIYGTHMEGENLVVIYGNDVEENTSEAKDALVELVSRAIYEKNKGLADIALKLFGVEQITGNRFLMSMIHSYSIDTAAYLYDQCGLMMERYDYSGDNSAVVPTY